MDAREKFLEYLRLNATKKDGALGAPTTEAPVEIPETNTSNTLANQELPPVETHAPTLDNSNNELSAIPGSSALIQKYLQNKTQAPKTQVELTPNANVPSYEADLLKAQQESDNTRNMARLQGAADFTARAFNNAEQNKDASEFYKTLESDSQLPVKKLQEKISIRDKATADQQKDPKSEISQLYRLALAKAMPQTDFTKLENLSAEQIEKLFPTVKSAIGSDSDLLKILSLQQAEDRLKQGTRKLDQSDTRINYNEKNRERIYQDKQELSDSQVKAIDTLDQTIGGLDDLQELKPAFDTGPIAGRVAKWRQALGNDNAKMTAFKAKVGRQLATYIKGMSGTAVSDQERQFLSTLVPSELDSDASFLEKAKDMKQEATKIRSRSLENFKRQGKNPTAFIDKNKGISSATAKQPELKSNEVRRATKDGKTAIFDTNTKQFLRYE